MNTDGIPNAIYQATPKHHYIAIAETDSEQSFAEALKEAEVIAKTNPGVKAHIYRIDATVEYINGVLSVRNRQ